MPASEVVGSVLDPYECLQVEKHASAAEIRSCYKKLALQYHPDKTRDETKKLANSKKFQEVQEAYEILSDDKKRKEYDEAQDYAAEIRELKKQEKEARRKAAEKASRREAREARQREMEEEDRRREEQMKADRRAEREYLASRKAETDQMEAALAAQRRRKEQAEQATKDEPRSERKRREGDPKKAKEEEMAKLEAIRREQERVQRHEEKKQRAANKEKRSREIRQDRFESSQEYYTPYETFEEPVEMPTPSLKATERGRASRERLGEHAAPVRENSRRRDGSRARDNSRNRDKPLEREPPVDFIPETVSIPLKDRERVRREEGGRRMSTEHTQYLRTPPIGPYGSPPQPSSAYYSPQPPVYKGGPPSPRPRNSMPSMASNKGRERSRKYPSDGYVREASYINPDDLEHLPGNRDSGYSTSSNTTPLKGAEPKLSAERLNGSTRDTPSGAGRRKKWVLISDEEESDDARDNVPRRRTSREDHSPPDVDYDPFPYQTSGPRGFTYKAGDPVYAKMHARQHSDYHPGTPKINVEDVGYTPYEGKPRKRGSREAPVSSVHPPFIHRNATYS